MTKENNLGKLRTACNEYMEFLESTDYNEDRIDNFETKVFEKALELFFGEDVWERVRKAMGVTL